MPLFARIFGADWDGEKIVLAHAGDCLRHPLRGLILSYRGDFAFAP